MEACLLLLRELTEAIERYRLDHAVYPRSGNASLVRSLLKPHPKLPFYFRFTKGTLNDQGQVIDPWERPLSYQNLCDRGFPRDAVEAPQGSFLLYSRGPDGRGRIQLSRPSKRSR